MHPVHHEEMKLIFELGVKTFRLAHSPHNHHYLDLIDKTEIISWSEIPFIEDFVDSQ